MAPAVTGVKFSQHQKQVVRHKSASATSNCVQRMLQEIQSPLLLSRFIVERRCRAASSGWVSCSQPAAGGWQPDKGCASMTEGHRGPAHSAAAALRLGSSCYWRPRSSKVCLPKSTHPARWNPASRDFHGDFRASSNVNFVRRVTSCGSSAVRPSERPVPRGQSETSLAQPTSLGRFLIAVCLTGLARPRRTS